MSNEGSTEPTAIQRESSAGGVARGRTGITASPLSALMEPPLADGELQLSGVPLLRRLPVISAGLALGSAFALIVAGPMMPSSWGLSQRALAWASVMGGPVVGTVWGLAQFHSSIGLGWLGLLLIPVHPIRPCAATACITVFGFCLWYFAGFVAMIAAVWGA